MMSQLDSRHRSITDGQPKPFSRQPSKTDAKTKSINASIPVGQPQLEAKTTTSTCMIYVVNTYLCGMQQFKSKWLACMYGCLTL